MVQILHRCRLVITTHKLQVQLISRFHYTRLNLQLTRYSTQYLRYRNQEFNVSAEILEPQLYVQDTLSQTLLNNAKSLLINYSVTSLARLPLSRQTPLSP